MRGDAFPRRCGISPPGTRQTPSLRPADHQSFVSNRAGSHARARRSLFFYFFIFLSHAMSSDRCVLAFLFGLLVFLPPRETHCATNVTEQVQADNALAKLVKMFSKPGAFKRVSRGDVQQSCQRIFTPNSDFINCYYGIFRNFYYLSLKIPMNFLFF